jgi:hypothetical protein
MPILEMRTAKQTSTKESDEGVSELASGIARFPSGGVAPEAFDRLFQAAFRLPILILRGAQVWQTRKPAYGFHLGGRCAP